MTAISVWAGLGILAAIVLAASVIGWAAEAWVAGKLSRGARDLGQSHEEWPR